MIVEPKRWLIPFLLLFVALACNDKPRGDEATSGGVTGQGGAAPSAGQGGAVQMPRKVAPPPATVASPPVGAAGQGGTGGASSAQGGAGGLSGTSGQGGAQPAAAGQGGRGAGRAAPQICGPNERRTADGRCAKASTPAP